MKCPECSSQEIENAFNGSHKRCLKCLYLWIAEQVDSSKEAYGTSGGAKDTAGKPRYSLLPRKGCLAVIEAREYGARKYGSDENWVNVSQKDWIEATLRHLYAFLDGEVKDPESGLDHLSHAACSAFLAASVKTTE